MPLPEIIYCILCEGVRAEPRGKANILGFYGLLPHANIIVGEIAKPLPELMFLVGLRGPAEAFSLGARIIAPDKSLIVATGKAQALKLPSIETESGAMGGIGFQGLSFPVEGLYKIELLINEEECRSETFAVRQGPPPSSV